MKTKPFFFLLTCLLVATQISVAQESYSIKYKFGGGNTYRYRIISATNITQEMMGQEIKIDVNADMIQKFEAEKPVDNKIHLKMSLDSATIRTRTPMKTDTTVLKDFFGKRELFVISESGKIIESRMLDTLSGQIALFKQVTNGLNKFFIFPDKPVKVGETWNSSDIDSLEMMGGKITTKSDVEYKLLGLKDTLGVSCIKVEINAKSTNEGAGSMMGTDFTLEGTGKSKGLLYFDPNLGIILATEMQVDNDMTMAATGEQSMIVPITQSSKITQSLIR